MGETISPEDRTYGIKGPPRPPSAIKFPGDIPYVKGLPVLSSMPVDDKLSYFQIAGIHGYPEVAWDGAPEPKHAPDKKTKQAGDQPFGGYCIHNSLNLPAWHRPYMLLFEQRIWDNMKLIINDWTKEYHKDLVCPSVLTQVAVRIYPPTTIKNQFPRSGLYPNPLVGFENPEKDPRTGKPLPFGSMPEGKTKWNIQDNPIVHDELPLKKDCDWAPWSKTSATSRYGIFKGKEGEKDPAGYFTGLEGINNCWKANASLARVHENGPDSKSRWSTMEQHSKYYTWNPGSLSDAVNRDPNTADTTASSVTDDKETDPLEPFHRKDNDHEKEVWTAQAGRDWTELNYQYDDLAEVIERTIRKRGRFIPGEFQEELRSHIDTIYPGTGHVIESTDKSSTVPDGIRPFQSQTKSWKDYIINVVYDRYALEGKDSTNFEKHNYVGHVYSFGGRQSTSEGCCRNCKRQAAAQVLSCAQVPLTIHLLYHIKDNIPDHSIDDHDEIEEYLRLHLRWRVVKYGGEVISEEGFKKNFSKLQISVLRGIGRIKSGNAQSAGSVSSLYSDYVPLSEITDGKPGGLRGDKASENHEPFVWQNKSTVQPLPKAK
ncbi:tyrosinase precursor [Fusarium mundagurra]|uniref:Tyrosinase n=1 Tax=Fusarium mundagurra TaxID=1567541 RepID=A0A8H5YCE1_9HYPO|nr:tyrosinase precursor [Fusarium mundagurra]